MLPDVGDIRWVDLDPAKGSEQAGRRPALVLTSLGFHQRCGRAVICPISSKMGTWPFNVSLPQGLKTRGSVLVDQIRVIERAERMFDAIERAPDTLVSAVREKLAALLGIETAASDHFSRGGP